MGKLNIKNIGVIHALIFTILILVHVFLFDYPIPIIFVGMLVISSMYSTLLWGIFLVRFFYKAKARILSITLSIILSIVSFSIILVYLIDYIANSNWTTNFTFRYIVKYAMQVKQLKSILPVPLEMIYLLIAAFALLILAFYIKSMPIIIEFVDVIVNKVKNNKLSKKAGIYTILSLLMAPLFWFSYSLTHGNFTDDLWNGEPLTDLFLPYTTIEINNTNRLESAKSNSNISVAEVEATDKPNIILIIADALRADHLGVYGYNRSTSPFIDKLVKSGKAIMVKNAFSTCAESKCGILSTLTSQPYNNINISNININSILKNNGYTINYILSTDHTWGGLSRYYHPYDLFYDGNNAIGKYAMTDDALVIDKLLTVEDYNKPTFFYFHLMSNHSSGIRKKQFAKYTPYKTPNDWFYKLPIISSIFSTNKVVLEKNYYDNGIISTDYYISKIFNILSSKGYLKNSVVWIMADHGEAIGEHGVWGHISGLYNEEVHIPMIIYDTKKDLYKEKYLATQLDFAPTILDRLGIDIPNSWKGTSLFKKKKGVYISYHNIPDRKGSKAAIIKLDNGKLYKVFYQNSISNVSAIYDLTKDPRELVNIYDNKNSKIVSVLLGLLYKDSRKIL